MASVKPVEVVARQSVDAADAAEVQGGDDVIGSGRHRPDLGDFGVISSAQRDSAQRD
jgi:hypothetical protein